MYVVGEVWRVGVLEKGDYLYGPLDMAAVFMACCLAL